MAEVQKTIASPITIKGKGLHTGKIVTLTVNPAQEDYGIVFKRTDLEAKPLIPALAENVTDTSRGTTLEIDKVRISTIEHLMAALYGKGINNALIEVDGPEVPILDGSAKLWVEAFDKVGVKAQSSPVKEFVVTEEILFSQPERGLQIRILPADEFSINITIDYNSPVLRPQTLSFANFEDFSKEIAPCRTFVFLREVEMLYQNNLIKGGDLNNAIVIVDREVSQAELDRLADLFNMPRVECRQGVLNNLKLRFADEPARHKVLDMIGDFNLTGVRIKGRVEAVRPGHFANTEMAKIIRRMITR